MEKRKWPWKKKPSERSPGDSESSGSFSSHSERYSDEQEVLRESPNDNLQSPEVTSKATTLSDDEVKETVKSLTEKLSAALVNVSAKEDLVKQHAKVAEEAVAGWEKAENEVAALKQQLEAAVQQNLNLEVRASHLDGALKECVRQLRQAKDEQDKRISDVMLENTRKWESEKGELKKQILDLKCEAQNNSPSVDPNISLILEALEKENLSLKQELVSCCKELEIMTIERDLSAKAAENASKLQLESIKKVAKLEAECRRLQSMARKSTPLSNQKSFGVNSFYADSLTDSCKSSNGSEQNCSDIWASALISELDQFKAEKPSPKNLSACSIEIDMMDDFLEMERLASLSETKKSTRFSGESISEDNTMRAQLDSMTHRVDELENKLKRIEEEKLELQNALDESEDSLKAAQKKMAEGEVMLKELRKELTALSETKEMLESQLVGMEVEARTLSANVDSLKFEIEEERKLSAELNVKCHELESELTTRIQETEVEKNNNSNGELKVKQEDIAIAADKLAECQKTIASLGRQLESLATLEDFLIDTSNIPGFAKASSNGGDIWRSSSKDTSTPKCDSDKPRTSMENHGNVANGDEDLLTTSSLTNLSTGAKSRNGFGKFFSRSKSVMELENSQD